MAVAKRPVQSVQGKERNETWYRGRFERLSKDFRSLSNMHRMGEGFADEVLASFEREFGSYKERVGRMETLLRITTIAKPCVFDGIPVDPASAYLATFMLNGDVRALTDGNILRFVKKTDANSATKYLMALQKKNHLQELVSDRIVDFAEALGQAARGYFHAVSALDNIENLFDERTTTSKVARFAQLFVVPGVNASINFFTSVCKSTDLDVMLDGELLGFAAGMGISRAAKLFEALAENRGLEKEFVEYYMGLFEANKGRLELYDVASFSKDPMFTQAAHDAMDRGSTILERHVAAGLMGSKATSELLDLVFSKETYTKTLLTGYLYDRGLTGFEKLSTEEMLRLAVESRAWLRVHKGRINTFLKGRSNGHSEGVDRWLSRRGFNHEMINGNRIVGRMESDGIHKSHVFLPYVALDFMVLGLNGSRDPDKESRHVDGLVGLFGLERTSRAILAWRKVRRENVKQLSEAYRNGDFERSVDIFRNAARTMPRSDRESVMSIVNELVDATATGNDFRGRSGDMVAYVVDGKINAINISSRVTACCAFMGGGDEKRHATFDYANAPGVVLVNFSVGAGKLDDDKVWTLETHGVAICVLGTSEWRKVLYVDSIEGGIKFSKAVEGKEEQVFGILSSYATEIGADFAVLSTTAAGDTPKRFIASRPETEREHIPLELFGRRLFLEGMPWRDLPLKTHAIEVLRL